MQSELTLKIMPELDAVNKAINQITKATSLSLSKAIDEPLKKLKNAYTTKAFGANIEEMGRAIKKATQTKLKLDIDEACASLDKMKLQIAGTLGAVYSLSKPISIAMDFETSMSDIKKVVDFESKAELKSFEKEIWNLTKTIPLAAKDLSAIVASGGQLGLEKNILIPFTDVVAKMSTAFDMGTAEAGDTIAGLMKKMGIGIDEVKELGDAINYIGAKSAGSPREVVNILGRIGGMAKTIGLSAEQTAGLAGAFANMKIPADQAGTAINKMLSVLGNAEGGSARFQNALAQIGLSGAEVKEMMKDPINGIREVLKAIEAADDSEKIGILKNIFGEEAGPKIAQITSNMNEFDKILGLVSKKENYLGSMQKEFDEVSNTTANAMQLMQNSFTRIANAIGSVFLPPLASLMKVIADIGSGIAKFLESFPKLTAFIGSVTIGIVGLKTATIGYKIAQTALNCILLPTKLALLNLLPAQFVATKGMNLLRLETYKAALSQLFFDKVLKIVSISMLKNPIGLAIAAIGLGASLIIKYWEPISAFFKGMFGGIKQALSPLLESLSKLWSSVKTAFAPLGKLFSWLFGKTESTKNGLESVANTGELVGQILGSVFYAISYPINLIIKAITMLFNSLSEITSFVADSKLGKWIGSFFEGDKNKPKISTNGLVDSTLQTQQANAQNFYNSTRQSQINDNKVINITTGANANEVLSVINNNSYTYGD